MYSESRIEPKLSIFSNLGSKF